MSDAGAIAIALGIYFGLKAIAEAIKLITKQEH
jgi:hypothetical protein